ncbi:MAG: SEC-C metal-binding domain-containing protein [Chlorobiales bacterium]|nr:SEC-C metal-binding domain-containing protein [Chlorobiales bacterium]
MKPPLLFTVEKQHQAAESVYTASFGVDMPGGEGESESENSPIPQQPVIVDKKPGRNDLCSCGSGKKYKNCHGQQP